MTDNPKSPLNQLAKLHSVPYWVFLALFAFSLSVSVIALRHNNQEMVRLRGEVYIADKNNTNVEKALDNLRLYVYAHMNTNLSSGNNAIKPPIQLKYTYERLQQKAQQAGNNNGLYTKAEKYCEGQVPAGAWVSLVGTTVPCVQNYIANHGGKPAPTIPPGLYEFDFVSPTWSPDLAGWSIVATALFFVAFAVSFVSDRRRS